MATPPCTDFDIVALASAAFDIAPTDLAATFTTVQAAAFSCEHVAAAAVAVGALAGPVAGAAAAVCPHPLAGFPFSVASASAAVGTTGLLVAVAAVGASAGTATSATGPLAATIAVGAPAGTAA
jgi:hypothetical protein